MPLYYTGVGSRRTPDDTLDRMTAIAERLGKRGFTLRSGGAIGADTAFEFGLTNGSSKDIYYARDATEEAIEMAMSLPGEHWQRDNLAAKLFGRNMFQVLGLDLKTPSKFLICWTPEGRLVGGTRLAIKCAQVNNIPVFNLFHPWEDIRDELGDLVLKLSPEPK